MNQMLKALHHERLERRSSGVCKVFQLGPSGHSKTVLQVKIFERGGAAIGSIVWPGAKFLCAFLLDNVDLLVKGKSAVELGAGCGLLGISPLPETPGPTHLDSYQGNARLLLAGESSILLVLLRG